MEINASSLCGRTYCVLCGMLLWMMMHWNEFLFFECCAEYRLADMDMCSWPVEIVSLGMYCNFNRTNYLFCFIRTMRACCRFNISTQWHLTGNWQKNIIHAVASSSSAITGIHMHFYSIYICFVSHWLVTNEMQY